MKHRSAAAALLVTASLLATGAGATAALADATADTKVKATLTTAPGGDQDGKGKFSATISEDSLCYSLTATNIRRVTGAHIRSDDGTTVVGLHRTGVRTVCI